MKPLLCVIILLLSAHFVSLLSQEVIEGTRVSLSAPKEFTKAKQFPGFIMEKTGASILVTEFPDSLDEITKNLTADRLISQGMVNATVEKVKHSTGESYLIHCEQKAHDQFFLKWILIIGSKNKSVMITANFPKSVSDEWSAKLKKSILSAKWDPNSKIDIWKGLTFTINSEGDLIPAQKMNNMVVFSRNGVFPQKDTKLPLVVAGPSLTQDWTVPGDKKLFAKNRVKHIANINDVKYLTEKVVEIDGMNGFLFTLSAKEKGANHLVVVVFSILFTDEGYFIFQAQVDPKEKERYQPIFLKMLNSLKRNKK